MLGFNRSPRTSVFTSVCVFAFCHSEAFHQETELSKTCFWNASSKLKSKLNG